MGPVSTTSIDFRLRYPHVQFRSSIPHSTATFVNRRISVATSGHTSSIISNSLGRANAPQKHSPDIPRIESFTGLRGVPWYVTNSRCSSSVQS